jgi:multidrug transporter EmrE-like cation transporter
MRDVPISLCIASAAKQSPLGVRTVMEIAAWLQETRIAFGITFTVMAGTGPAMTLTAGFILFTVPRLP